MSWNPSPKFQTDKKTTWVDDTETYRVSMCVYGKWRRSFFAFKKVGETWISLVSDVTHSTSLRTLQEAFTLIGDDARPSPEWVVLLDGVREIHDRIDGVSRKEKDVSAFTIEREEARKLLMDTGSMMAEKADDEKLKTLLVGLSSKNVGESEVSPEQWKRIEELKTSVQDGKEIEVVVKEKEKVDKPTKSKKDKGVDKKTKPKKVGVKSKAKPDKTETVRRVRGELSAADAAYEVLSKSKTPMTIQQMLEKVMERGIWKTNGKTPGDTIKAQIFVEMKRKGKEARFEKVGRGLFSTK